MVGAHRRINRIHSIEARGHLWVDRGDAERGIVNFYEHLYTGAGCFRPKLGGISFVSIPLDKLTSLEAIFTIEEIWSAVAGMSGDRASGPDGFPVALFKQFWDLIEDDLSTFFAEFLKIGLSLSN